MADAPRPPPSSKRDSWVRRLAAATADGARARESAREPSPQPTRPAPLLAICCELGSSQEYLHTFISTYVAARFPPATAQKLTLASYELIENGLRYSSLAQDVVYELADLGRDLEVSVRNAAVRSRLAMLEERVARLAVDPAGLYEEELRRSVAGGVRRPMLGLARIRHEAQMALSVEMVGSVVTVRARCHR